MKLQATTIKSDYNEETGLSKVTILTDIGAFDGYASLHPDDKEIESNFAGCRNAEMRANIKYMKMKKKIFEAQIKILKSVYNQTKNKNALNVLKKELYLLEDDKETLQLYINSLSNKLNTMIQERPEIIKNLQQKDNN